MRNELLREVVAKIPAERLDMSYWVRTGWDDLDDDSGSPATTDRLLDGSACDTVGCLAGWVCANEGLAISGYSCYDAATAILSLRNSEAERLFWLSFWPVSFKSRYHLAKSNDSRLAVLRDRVEHFIATEGRDA